MIGPRTTDDLAAFNGWLDTSMDAARAAAAATLQARLADVASQARSEREQIERETHLADRQGEYDRLEASLPVLSGEVEVIAQLAVEARSFL